MSYYVTNENSFLDIKNAHLRVTGNVHTDVLKLGAIEFQPTGSEVTGTVNFTNVTTGVTTSSNLNVGGTLQLGTVEVVATTHTLANTTALGNVTPHTIEVSNVTTGLVTTANVEVGRDLVVSGNVAVDTNTLFVDSVNDRVGIGTVSPGYLLDVQSTSDAADKNMTRLYSAANASGVSSTGLRVEKGTGYGGIVKGFISQGVGSGLSLHTLNGGTDVQAMTIMNSGNVGIGTTSPTTKLEVVGDIRIPNGSSVTTSITDAFTHDGDSMPHYGLKWRVHSTQTGANLMQLSGYHGFKFFTQATERLTITPTGNVGIGTNSPQSPFHVNPINGTTDSENAFLDFRRDFSPHGHLGIFATETHTNAVGPDLRFKGSIYNGTSNPTIRQVMCLKPTGNVGIGTTNPLSKLQIKPNHTSYSNPQATSGLAIYNETNSDPSITHSILLLRTGGSSGGDPFISYDINAEHGWVIGVDNSAGTQFRFAASWANFTTTVAYISTNSTAAEIDFTGQHRSFISNVPHTEYLNLEGLIVSANKNQYFDIQEEIVTGVQAIKINESLPLVAISNVAYDKCCFGVISGSEDTNDREYSQGSFVSVLKKQDGDIRAHINSVGEGAIWVTNLNGTLESGDYITTSNVAGYGQKQDDDILHNYTVAKITMDCDFNPSTQPNRIIKRELRDVNYWVKYTYDDISEEEYTRVKNLGRRVRIIESGTEISQEEYENHLKKEGYTETESNMYIRNETTHQRVFSDKEKEPKEGYELEVRNEPVNVLDEHGQIQWEDHTTETEKAYKIRHLDANGVITDEANAVHTAAFVGCTYHCG
jgi:hypothetical protein